MDIEKIKRHVEKLNWYHTLDLGNNIITPGVYDHRPYLAYYGFPEDLTNKTALDIGAASGFFSFEMEKRGAKVTATDLSEWVEHDFSPIFLSDQTEDEGNFYLKEPFAFARKMLNSNVIKREINIYDISPQTVGMFDLVFCGSVLIHLTDPVKALWQIQKVTQGVAIIATVINQNMSEEPLAQFIGHDRGDGYWIPNRSGFEAMIQTAGFSGWEWVSEFFLDYRDGRPGPYHGVIRAWNSLEGFDISKVKLPQKTIMKRPRLDFKTVIEKDAQIAQLKALVNDYERGRFIKLMRFLKNKKR